MITQSTYQPTNKERLLAYRVRKHRHEALKAIEESVRRLSDGLFCVDATNRSGTGRASSDAADYARSRPGGFFKNLLGALGLLTVLATAWTVAESLDTSAPEPECRKQWTKDSRYVRHCNFHNGRGWVVTP